MMKRNRVDAEALQEQCRRWNAAHPVGTVVDYHPILGEPESIRTRTRYEAYVLSGHTAVIFVEEKSGCVALDSITIPDEGEK